MFLQSLYTCVTFLSVFSHKSTKIEGTELSKAQHKGASLLPPGVVVVEDG